MTPRGRRRSVSSFGPAVYQQPDTSIRRQTRMPDHPMTHKPPTRRPRRPAVARMPDRSRNIDVEPVRNDPHPTPLSIPSMPGGQAPQGKRIWRFGDGVIWRLDRRCQWNTLIFVAHRSITKSPNAFALPGPQSPSRQVKASNFACASLAGSIGLCPLRLCYSCEIREGSAKGNVCETSDRVANLLASGEEKPI